MNTRHVYEDLPPMLNPAPTTETEQEQENTDDTPHWDIYQYEDVDTDVDGRLANTCPL